MVRQIERFLDGRIAAADDDDLLAAEEKPVAGRTGRDAEAAEHLFARQSKPARLRAGGEDQRFADIGGAQIASRDKGPPAEIDRRDQIGDDPGPDMLRLLLHLLHQPRALHRLGKARVVLDLGGDRQLAPGLQSHNQQRLEIGARRVDRRSIAGGARAND